ncbi:MAG: dCTP deaminase [Sphingomonas phyllosphaerae]
MLSAEEIQAKLHLEPGNSNRLSIVPKPDLASLRGRAATSVDLRLGRWFKSFKQNQTNNFSLWHEEEATAQDRAGIGTKQHFVPFGQPFVLHPGRFVLGVTLEWLSLPPTLSGYVTGKSSLGRHGLIIETAAGIHPNFTGCLTLELANCGEVPLTLSPGMTICQIFLHATQGGGQRNLGDFSGQRKPSIKLPSRDPIFEKLRAEFDGGGRDTREEDTADLAEADQKPKGLLP